MRKKEEAYSRIAELWEEGKKPQEIAAEVGYTKASVYNILTALGLRQPRKASHVSDWMPELIKMRGAGKTLKEMAERTGLNMATICKALSEAGVQKRIQHDTYQKQEAVPILRKEIPIKTCVVGGKQYQDVTDYFLENRI